MDLEMTPEEIKERQTIYSIVYFRFPYYMMVRTLYCLQAQLVCLQDENTKLRQYIDQVLTAIMENCADLLEVKTVS